MKLNKFNLTLLGSIFLAGCNGGHQVVQQENTEQQETSEASKPSFHLKYVTVSTGTGEEMAVAYDDVKIGYGYNPQTGELYHTSKPILSSLGYAADPDKESSSLIRPIDACPKGFEEHDFGQDFGNITFSDLDSVWDGNAGVGVNYGLAKIKVAAAYNNQQTTNKGEMAHDKYFGGKMSCWIRSFADLGSKKNPTIYKALDASHFADALKNSNYDIRSSIGDIRKAQATGDQKATNESIRKFYENFGTYMVSAVEISEFATMRLTMKENTTDTTSKWGVSAAANFAYPGVTVDAGMSHAHADKISTKNWEITTDKRVVPMGSAMDGTIDKMMSYVASAIGGGIINFSNLTHDSASATKPDKPTLPTIDATATAEYETKKTFDNLLTNYNDLIKINAKDVKDKKTVKTLKDSIEITLGAKKNVDNKIAGLNSDQNKKYAEEIIPYLSAIEDHELLKKASDYVSAQNADKLKLVVEAQALVKDGANGATDARKDQSAKILAFQTKYPALSTYLKDVYTNSDVKYGGSEIVANIEAINRQTITSVDKWMEYLEGANNNLKGQEIKTALKKNYIDILQGNKVLTLSSKLKNNAVPKLLEKPILTNDSDDTALYGNRPITDFNIVPWSVVFPELLGTYALDDSQNTISLTIRNKIDTYMRKYRYLQVVASVTNDAELDAAASYEKNNTHDELAKLSKQLVELDTSDKTMLTLNEIDYDMKIESQQNAFYTKLNEMTGSESTSTTTFSVNPSNNLSTWNKIVNKLMDRNLIGQYAAIPAIQPNQNQDNLTGNYYLFNGSGEQPLPTYTSDQWTGFKDRVKRIILQIVWNEIYNKKGQAGNTQPIPPGVLSYNTDSTVQKDGFVINVKDNYNTDKTASSIDYATGDALGKIANNTNASMQNPYHVLGYLPIVTTKTTQNESEIDGIGLLSSTGRIIGSGANITNAGQEWKMSADSSTYNLDLKGGDANHIYQLAINGETFDKSYPVVEFHWQLENRPEAVGVKEDGIYIGFKQTLGAEVFSSCNMTFVGWDNANWKSPNLSKCDGKNYDNGDQLRTRGVWYADDKGEKDGIMGFVDGSTYKHVYGIKFNNPFSGPYLSKHIWSNWNADGKTNKEGWWQFTPKDESHKDDIGYSATSRYWKDGEDKDRTARYGDWVIDGIRATTVHKLALIPVTTDTIRKMNDNSVQNVVLPTFIH